MKCLMYSISDEDFLSLIRRSGSIKDVLQELGYTNTSGQSNLLFHQRCKELNIDWKKELRTKNQKREKRTFENVFCENSTVNQSTLRSWYLKNEYVDYKCAICGISEWNGQELSLRLDHINGVNNDNRLANLRWLCPNCDSQQDTYCGRNLKYQPYKNGKYCIDCGKPITKNSKIKRCEECAHKQQRKVKDRPDKETLYKELKESNFIEVGKKYGVSDNSVRKWCRYYGLSDKAKDYKPEKPMKNTYNPQTNKPCIAYDLNEVKLKQFKNVREAANWALENSSAKSLNGIASHIVKVCNNEQKTAYGYKWKFVE